MTRQTVFDIDPFAPLFETLSGPVRPAPAVVGVFEGTSGNDLIQAGTPDADGDEIDGVDGLDDVIEAGDGDDMINAGDGIDTVTYQSADAGIKLNRGTGTEGDANGDQLSNVEIVVGSDFRDDIVSDFG